MAAEGWITLGVLAVVMTLLVATRRAPDMIMIGGLVLLMIVPVPTAEGVRLGVLTTGQALSGFANEGMITVAVLFVVAAGLRDTGGTAWLAARLLGGPRSVLGAQARLMIPTAGMSAFLNNTTLVAMLLPVLGDWARKHRVAIAKLMIPLSYASILGGVCTLIGTSTNLIVNGWVIEHTDHRPLGMFEITWVGLPIAAVGIGYVLIAGRWLLPDRKPPISPRGNDVREYTVEMLVEPGSPLEGKTIEEAGLRHLPGLYLVEIAREGQVLPAVSPHVRLRGNDRLVFVGIVESVVDLVKVRGLVPATEQVYKIDEPRTNRVLVEAVVSNTCPLVGRTIRRGRFRTVYNAAVIAVARNGERIKGVKIGDITLRAGDTLLLEARSSFAEQHRDSRDFYLVSSVADSTPPRHERAPLAALVLAGLVVSVTAGWLSMLQAALVAGVLMVLTGCCRASAARRAIDWQVLLVIVGALGIGRALEVSGAAHDIAMLLVGLVSAYPGIEDPRVAAFWTLVVIYLLTVAFTEMITNNAAAVLVLPIAFASAEGLGVSPLPFVFAVMIAASASFATPIGYQTNLMVYGPGGYRFSDYLRIGAPLGVIVFVLAMVLIPRVWGF